MNFAAAVDEIGEGEIDVGQSLLRGANDEGAAPLSTVSCLTSKTLRTTLPNSSSDR